MAQYLRNKDTGVVYVSEPVYAGYPHMTPCNADGSDLAEIEEAPLPQFTDAVPAEGEAVAGDPIEEAPVVEEAPAPKKSHHKAAAK